MKTAKARGKLRAFSLRGANRLADRYITMPYLQSAALETIAYDENTHILRARFRDSGRTVVYEGVPQELYDELIFADSIGAFVRQRIEGIYPARDETHSRG